MLSQTDSFDCLLGLLASVCGSWSTWVEIHCLPSCIVLQSWYLVCIELCLVRRFCPRFTLLRSTVCKLIIRTTLVDKLWFIYVLEGLGLKGLVNQEFGWGTW